MTVVRTKIKRRKKRPGNPVQQMLRSPQMWPVLLLEIWTGWIQSRSWVGLGLGSACSLLFLMLWVFLTFGRASNELNQIAWYLRQFALAHNEDSPRLKEAIVHRLANINASEENRVRLAMSLLDSKEEATAAMLLSILAPEDTRGIPEAHLRLAQILLRSGSAKQLPIERLTHHAWVAFENMPNSVDAKAVWAQVLLRSGEDLKAVSLLEEAAKEIPELNSEIAAIHQRMGNRENAQRYFDLVVENQRSRLRRDREDVDAYRAILQVYILQERFFEAVQFAEEAFRDAPMPQTKQLLVETIQIYLDGMTTNEQLGVVGITWLRRAIELEPRLQTLIERLIRTLTLQSEDDWNGVRDALERDLAQNRARTLTRMILAMGLAEHGSDRYSQFHLRQAVLEDKNSVGLASIVYLVAKWLQPPEDAFADRWMAILESTLPNERELQAVKEQALRVPGRDPAFPVDDIQLPQSP